MFFKFIFIVNLHAELQSNNRKHSSKTGEENNARSNHSTSEQINFSSGFLSKPPSSIETIGIESDEKVILAMAQHTQASIHQQQSQQHVQSQQSASVQQQQQQQLVSQQNNNYQQHHQQQQHPHSQYTQMPSGVYMPSPNGAMYSLPSVYVNSLTANVNLNGWTAAHSLPGSYLPGNGSTFIPSSEMSPNMQHEQV